MYRYDLGLIDCLAAQRRSVYALELEPDADLAKLPISATSRFVEMQAEVERGPVFVVFEQQSVGRELRFQLTRIGALEIILDADYRNADRISCFNTESETSRRSPKLRAIGNGLGEEAVDEILHM